MLPYELRDLKIKLWSKKNKTSTIIKIKNERLESEKEQLNLTQVSRKKFRGMTFVISGKLCFGKQNGSRHDGLKDYYENAGCE